MRNFLDMPKKVQRSFQGEVIQRLPSPLTHISPVPLTYSSRMSLKGTLD